MEEMQKIEKEEINKRLKGEYHQEAKDTLQSLIDKLSPGDNGTAARDSVRQKNSSFIALSHKHREHGPISTAAMTAAQIRDLQERDTEEAKAEVAMMLEEGEITVKRESLIAEESSRARLSERLDRRRKKEEINADW